MVIASQAAAAGDTVIITDDGRVGIGVSKPTNLMHVLGDNASIKIEANSTSSSNGSLVLLNTNQTDGNSSAIHFRTATDVSPNTAIGYIRTITNDHTHATRSGTMHFDLANSSGPQTKMTIFQMVM
jgi:hypothetical protein